MRASSVNICTKRPAVVTSLICSTYYISLAISFLPVTNVSAIYFSSSEKCKTIVRLGSLERVGTSILKCVKQLRIRIKSMKTRSFVICYRYRVFFLCGYMHYSWVREEDFLWCLSVQTSFDPFLAPFKYTGRFESHTWYKNGIWLSVLNIS